MCRRPKHVDNCDCVSSKKSSDENFVYRQVVNASVLSQRLPRNKYTQLRPAATGSLQIKNPPLCICYKIPTDII